jgi:hypothetical protein
MSTSVVGSLDMVRWRTELGALSDVGARLDAGSEEDGEMMATSDDAHTGGLSTFEYTSFVPS